jgi:hypothetical protein
MQRHILLITLGAILLLLAIQNVSALTNIAVPNGSFEEGTLCTTPDHWVMKTWDCTEPLPPISTYIHEVGENDTHYFSGSRSCWLHSKVVDTDGTKRARYSHTWIESEDWLDQPNAVYVRFYIREIQPTHSNLNWGWNDEILIGFIDGAIDGFNTYFIFNNGEYLNFNYCNGTKVGADGATWYEYVYPIPTGINKAHFKVQINCVAGDWTFYDTSYFADMSFYVDNIELLCEPLVPSAPVGGYSISIAGKPVTNPILVYAALVTISAIVVSVIKRKS